MVRRDAAFLKQTRLHEISKRIASQIDKGVYVTPLYAWIAYNFGLTRAKAEEYVDLIIEVHEDWENKNGKIIIRGS